MNSFNLPQPLRNIIDIRDVGAQFLDSSLADLYDPLTIPPALAKAVDRLYLPKTFATDADRVALLFSLYKEVTGE